MRRLLLGGFGKLNSVAHRIEAIDLVSGEHAARADIVSANSEISIFVLILKSWRKAVIGDGDSSDSYKGSQRLIAHKLSENKHQRILLTCSTEEHASVPHGQIVPALADQGLYIGSESSIYRVLHACGQEHSRGQVTYLKVIGLGQPPCS